MNPLYNLLGGGQVPGPMGNAQQMMQKFQQFASTFRGDPRQQVQNLLNSGRMTQAQYNQLQQMASQMQKFMGRK